MLGLVVCSHEVSCKHIGELGVQRVSPHAKNLSPASWLVAIMVIPRRAMYASPVSDVCQPLNSQVHSDLEKLSGSECDYSDQILEIIDNVDSYTRSDLQGVVEALVRKIMRESSNNLCKKCGRTVE
jgi:hypothetical protein